MNGQVAGAVPVRVAYVFPGGVDQVGGAETQATHFFHEHDASRIELTLILLGRNPAFERRVRQVPSVRLVVIGDRAHALRRPSTWLRLWRHLRRERYDVVHLYGLLLEVFARPTSAMAGCGAIVSAIRSAETHRGAVHVLLNRLTSGYVDLWISNSQNAADVFAERDRVPREDITVVRSGVPDPYGRAPDSGLRSRAREILGLDDSDFAIGLVGNHCDRKRQVDLVKAASICRDRGVPTKLFLFGQRSEESTAVERLAAETDVCIAQCGPVDDVASRLPGLDVFVLPSLDEGVPAAVLEAMMAALPVVATDVGGTREAVTDGQSGFLVPIRSPEVLAERILTLHASRERRVDMGRAGREFVLEVYGTGRLARELMDIYEFLAGRVRGDRS